MSADEEQIKADIVAARAELAETADAIAAKLDVKAQASERLHAAGEKLSTRYDKVRAATPEPVQTALSRAQQAAQPVLNAAAEDKKRTAMVVGGALLGILLLRRVRNGVRNGRAQRGD